MRMRGTAHLLLDASREIPILIKSDLSVSRKIKIIIAFTKISIKLFTIHRIRPIHEENIMGFRVRTFDYGALHFLFREIFLKNEYYFHTKVHTKNTIFDCGANIGMATLYFKWLYPKSTIYAFEPDPKTFRLLEKNIKSNNLKNVYLYNVALSNKKGEIEFFTDSDRPGWLTMSIIHDRIPSGTGIKVQTDTLSSYIGERVDFLKLDTEGAEGLVLDDLVRSKKIKYVKKMAIEYHFDKVSVGDLADFIDKVGKERFSIEFSASPSGYGNRYQDILMLVSKDEK